MNNLVWHIVKKDFRRLWLTVVFQVVALLGATVCAMAPYSLRQENSTSSVYKAVLDIADRTGHPLQFLKLVEATAILLMLVNYGLLMVLVCAALTEDTPLGDRSFWRTRPVSGRQMLTAKAIFLALITWPVPMALYACFGWPAGPFHDWPMTTELFFGQTVFVATIAICTLLWRQMLLGVGVLMAAFFVALSEGFLNSPHSTWAFYFLWPMLAFAIGWWMYLRHNRIVGYAMLAVGILFLFGVGRFS